MSLTAAAVSKLKTRKVVQTGKHEGEATRTEVPDGSAPGLYLVVYPTGKKSWIVRYRAGDKNRKLTLGPVTDHEMSEAPIIGQPLTLFGARQLANDIARQRAFGRDPAAERSKARKDKQKVPADLNTFAQAAERWVNEYARKNQRRWVEGARRLGLREDKDPQSPTYGKLVRIPDGLAELWSTRHPRDISSTELREFLADVRDEGVPGIKATKGRGCDSRHRVMAGTLNEMFGWLVFPAAVIDSNPMEGVKRPKQAGERERVLTDAEIKAFWTGAGEQGPVVGPALRLLLVLGQRLNEVVEMERAELKGDALWVLPPKRTKNGNRTKKPHEVYLPPLARELIASVPQIAGRYVFTLNGDNAVTIGSKLKARLDARMAEQLGLPSTYFDETDYEWRLHDLRRTCATGLGDLDVDPHIIEAVLNHVSGTIKGVARTYNRAKYEARKRDALERWAVRLAEIVK